MSGENDDPFLISARVRQKLADKHNVVPAEVEQCFLNFNGSQFLEDEREEHRTDPSTKWFISETDSGRLLKICFMKIDKNLQLNQPLSLIRPKLKCSSKLNNLKDTLKSDVAHFLECLRN